LDEKSSEGVPLSKLANEGGTSLEEDLKLTTSHFSHSIDLLS